MTLMLGLEEINAGLQRLAPASELRSGDIS